MSDRAGRHRAPSWIAGLTLFLAACGGSSSTPAPPAKAQPGGAQSQGQKQIAEGAKQVTEGAKQVARGTQQLIQAAATPVDFETLKTMLPEVGGWKKVASAGEMISLPVPYANAHARYTKDTSTVELEITDTALSQVLLAPATMFMSSGFEERSDDGYKKALTFHGVPGYEDWNKTAKTADLMVVVANRFVVHGKGREVASVDPVRTIVQAVNFQLLAKLK